MYKTLPVTFCFLCIYCKICFSQTLLSNVKYQAEAGTYLSTAGVTPFWLRSNQYGIVPLSSPIITFRGSVHKEYDSTKNEQQQLRKIDIGYGFGGVANISKRSGLLLPEAYVKVRYGAFEFYGGRRREIVGLVDTTLTSGSYIWSGNALPMPKVQISVPNFTSIIGHGLISVKGSIAHGWFGNQTFAQNYYLHQKTFYVRIGRPEWKINFYSGFNHQVQWGGFAPALINNPYVAQNGYLPSDFNYFMNVAFPFSFVRKAFQPKTKIGVDSDNYGGNQLGSVDFAGEIKLKKMKIFIYRQLPYELGSLFSSLVNADDGLYGISVKLLKPYLSINRFTIEGFHSFNQGVYRSGIARLLNLKDNHLGEYHNYLNHGQYGDGWSYNNIGIGTPLILSDNELSSKIEQKHLFSFSSYNKVKSISGMLEGNVLKFNYGVKFNYSIYKQTNSVSNSPKFTQCSFNIFSKFKLKNDLLMMISYAFDKGEIINNSNGVSFSLLKNWY